MKQIHAERPKARRDRRLLEALPLDPRDPDVRRAKARARSTDETTPGSAPTGVDRELPREGAATAGATLAGGRRVEGAGA